MKYLWLIAKNVRRNPVRTLLTSLGTMVLVLVVTLVWSVLSFLAQATQEQAQNLKVIVTERWQLPSRLPLSYIGPLERFAVQNPGDEQPLDSMMTWQFYLGTLDPKSRAPESQFFALAMEPRKIYTMLDELDTLPPAEKAALRRMADQMQTNRRGIIVGQQRLKLLNKRVGERMVVTSLNYREIDLEFEILGVFPPGRYDLTAAFHRDYLNDSLDDWSRKHSNRKHPMVDKTLNLVWFRFPDNETFTRVAADIAGSPSFTNPTVKCETASSGIASFLDAYRDLLWGVRWLLSPAVLASLALVIANAISISVRERRQELAVMKVLGFRPWQLLLLVLGEAVLLGAGAGLMSAGATYLLINSLGGIKFPVVFFSSFQIAPQALWWGPAVGAGTALAGSLLPAWSARSVRVSEVFAKVA